MCRCRNKAMLLNAKINRFFFFSSSPSRNDFNVCSVSRTLTLTILNVYGKLLCVSFFISSFSSLLKSLFAQRSGFTKTLAQVQMRGREKFKPFISRWGLVVYFICIQSISLKKFNVLFTK